VVVLHVGGAAGGIDAALERFEQGFELLSPAARARVAVENDDRCFGLGDVLRLSERIGRPVVWDALNHRCHDPDAIPDREALALALATWPSGVVPKVHYASPKTAVEERRKRVGGRVERSLVLPELRAHADLIDPISFEHFIGDTGRGMDFDVMLEARPRTSRCGACVSSSPTGPRRHGRDPDRHRGRTGAQSDRHSSTNWANC
jgi:UV DNA damage endonuclease